MYAFAQINHSLWPWDPKKPFKFTFVPWHSSGKSFSCWKSICTVKLLHNIYNRQTQRSHDAPLKARRLKAQTKTDLER